MQALQTVTWLTGLGDLLGLGLACWALSASRGAWRRHQRPQDLALQATAVIWLLSWVLNWVLVTGLQAVTFWPQGQVAARYVGFLGLQALVVSLGFLLLSVAGVARSSAYLMLAGQALLGLVVMHWQPWQLADTFAQFSASASYPLWVGINLLAAAGVTWAVAQQLRQSHSVAGWLALSACLLGMAMCADALVLNGGRTSAGPLTHAMYAFFVCVVWRVGGDRGSVLTAGLGAQPSGQTMAGSSVAGFPGSAGLEPLSDFGTPSEVVAAAVAHERRRIGQDLHDGVASQLVNILSSIDVHAPQQRAIGVAIEQCLVDLKTTVDALDTSHENVLDALGKLRYQVQHSLDKLGIRMSWRVELRDELEAVRGEVAQHALRIAQEALANVMVHAQATAVEVVCRFVPESNTMVLEVRDNGCGIARRKQERAVGNAAQRIGKGLTSMRQRAEAVGGELAVSSKLGTGTRVRLSVPLASVPQGRAQANRSAPVRAVNPLNPLNPLNGQAQPAPSSAAAATAFMGPLT